MAKRLRRLLVLGALSGVLALSLLAGCSFNPGAPKVNEPPRTTLSFSPDSGSTANYRVRMNWFGWDKDGYISYYETAWDHPDSLPLEEADWVTVVNTDSIFYLSAYADSIDEERGYEYHSFAVRAVDNDGEADPSPESISFTAFTIVPDTDIIRGPAGGVVTGPMVTYEWLGNDRDGVISGYGYRLSKRDDVTQEFLTVTTADSLPETHVSQDFGPLDAGKYRFQAWSYDDAGARDQSPAMEEFFVNPSLAGAKLYVVSNVFGVLDYRGPIWAPKHNLPTSIFEGERLSFNWTASAETYGGQIVGYRHAFDDTTVWPVWSAFSTQFQVRPRLGEHSLYVSVLDNANVVTRGRVFFEVVDATLDGYILVVDDWNYRETMPIWGTDAQRNDFYDEILAGYVHERFEWQPDQHDLEPPSVDALRGASTVIWYADQEETALKQLFTSYLSPYNALLGYMRVGGNIVLSGSQILTQITQESYPFEIDEEDTTTGAVFVRDFLHIEYAANSGGGVNQAEPWNYGYCFYGAIPSDPSLGFEPICIDSLGKWSFVFGSGGNYAKAGQPNVEKLRVAGGTGLDAFRMDAHLNYTYENQPCGVLYLTGDNHGNSCYFGFPLYYCQTEQAKATLRKVLDYFGEERIQ